MTTPLLQVACDKHGNDIFTFEVGSEAEACSPEFQQQVRGIVRDMLRAQQQELLERVGKDGAGAASAAQSDNPSASSNLHQQQQGGRGSDWPVAGHDFWDAQIAADASLAAALAAAERAGPWAQEPSASVLATQPAEQQLPRDSALGWLEEVAAREAQLEADARLATELAEAEAEAAGPWGGMGLAWHRRQQQQQPGEAFPALQASAPPTTGGCWGRVWMWLLGPIEHVL